MTTNLLHPYIRNAQQLEVPGHAEAIVDLNDVYAAFHVIERQENIRETIEILDVFTASTIEDTGIKVLRLERNLDGIRYFVHKITLHGDNEPGHYHSAAMAIRILKGGYQQRIEHVNRTNAAVRKLSPSIDNVVQCTEGDFIGMPVTMGHTLLCNEPDQVSWSFGIRGPKKLEMPTIKSIPPQHTVEQIFRAEAKKILTSYYCSSSSS